MREFESFKVCLREFYIKLRSFSTLDQFWSSWIFVSICNPYNSVDWIRLSPFFPKDIGKLSYLINHLFSLIIWFVLYLCWWLFLPRYSDLGDWYRISESRNKWYHSIMFSAISHVSIVLCKWDKSEIWYCYSPHRRSSWFGS